MSLNGLRVLVTRPEGQAKKLLQGIRRAAGQAWHYPVMAISALHDPEQKQQCKQLIMELDTFQHVIFISSNAVRFGSGWINEYWPQLPVGVHWHGIGKSTIETMLAVDIPVVGLPAVDSTAVDSVTMQQANSGAMNSEQLLENPLLQKLQHQKILIIRGVGGREYLQQQLSQRGASVNYAECYQRQCVDKPEADLAQFIEREAINTLCVNSGESLQHLCALLGENYLASVTALRIIVPGQRVASLAEQQGFTNIVVAENASDARVLDALSRISYQQ